VLSVYEMRLIDIGGSWSCTRLVTNYPAPYSLSDAGSRKLTVNHRPFDKKAIDNPPFLKRVLPSLSSLTSTTSTYTPARQQESTRWRPKQLRSHWLPSSCSLLAQMRR